MRLALVLVPLLVACQPAPESAGLGDDDAPMFDDLVGPPVFTLQVDVPPLVRGETHTITVSGAEPGRRVYLGVSVNYGPGFCPRGIAPTCLDIAQPIDLLGNPLADASGEATFELTLNPGFGFDELELQAGGPTAAGVRLSNSAWHPVSDPPPCLSAVVSEFPADGAIDVPVSTLLQAQLTEGADLTDLRLLRASDSANIALGPESVLGDGTSVLAQPLLPLEPSTAYRWRINTPCGIVDRTFTTSAAGTAVDPADAVGTTWVVDYTDAHVVEPVGIGPLLLSLLDSQTSTLGGTLTAWDPVTDTITGFSGAVVVDAGGPVQDLCQSTLDLTLDGGDNPFLSLALPDVETLDYDGSNVSLYGSLASGLLTPDGQGIVGMDLSTSLDIAPLAGLLGVASPADACDLLALFSDEPVLCAPCPSGASDSCVDVRVVNVSADPVPGFTMTPRTYAEVQADPGCAP